MQKFYMGWSQIDHGYMVVEADDAFEANEKFERGEFEVEAPEVKELEFKIYKRGYDLDFECSGDMPANLYDALRQTVENWYEENGQLGKNM